MESNCLEHYGVLGMKWGVRRYQPYAKEKAGKFITMDRDKDIFIKSGSYAYRAEYGKDSPKRNLYYVTFDNLDHLGSYLPLKSTDRSALRDKEKNEKVHSIRLKLTEDMILPSYQNTIDTFIKTIGKQNAETLAKRYFPTINEGTSFIQRLRKEHVNKVRHYAYLAFMGEVGRDETAAKTFIKNLKKQGYTGLIDEEDFRYGRTRYKGPVIVFDKDKSLTQIGDVALNKTTENALKRLQDARFDTASGKFTKKEMDALVELTMNTPTNMEARNGDLRSERKAKKKKR